jgi:exopolysaccharide production protein ExoQ
MHLSPQSDTAPSRAEKAFVVFVLLLSTGAFMSLSVTPDQAASDPSGMPGMQILWSLIYVVTLVLFSRHCQRPLETFLSEKPLIGLCILAIASTLWSQAPQLTLRRSVALLLTMLFGIYFGTRFRMKQQLSLLAWTCGICVVFSFVFGVLGLGMSVDADEGVPGWYGIFVQKNNLGRMMVLSALVFLFWKRAEPEHKGIAKAGFLASILLIFLSQSMTSIIVLAMLLVLLRYLPRVLGKSAVRAVGGMVFLLAAGTIAIFWVASHLEQIADFLNRSVTLTGRLTIWILSTVMALRRPWLGYGYNAFWLPGQWTTERIWLALDWAAPHAHNGLLELWLELGIVGMGLFLLVFVYYSLRSIGFLRWHGSAAASAWPLMFLVFTFLSNLTESDFLARDSIFVILYVTVAITLQQQRVPEKANSSAEEHGTPTTVPCLLGPVQAKQKALQ